MRSKSILTLFFIIITMFSTVHLVSAQTDLQITIKKGQTTWLPKAIENKNSIVEVKFICSNCTINFYVVNVTNYVPDSSPVKNPIIAYENVSTFDKSIQLKNNGTYYFGFQNVDLFSEKTLTVTLTLKAPTFDYVAFIFNLIPYVLVSIIVGIGINYLWEKRKHSNQELNKGENHNLESETISENNPDLDLQESNDQSNITTSQSEQSYLGQDDDGLADNK